PTKTRRMRSTRSASPRFSASRRQSSNSTRAASRWRGGRYSSRGQIAAQIGKESLPPGKSFLFRKLQSDGDDMPILDPMGDQRNIANSKDCAGLRSAAEAFDKQIRQHHCRIAVIESDAVDFGDG